MESWLNLKKIAPEFKHTDTYETSGYGAMSIHYVFRGPNRPDEEGIQNIADIQKKARRLGYKLKN